jgi:hypothetical protein
LGLTVFGVTIVLVSPFRASIVDRHGPRRVLPPMAAGFATVLVAIAVIPARAVLSGQLVGRIPLSACLPVLAASALLAVVPLLWTRLMPAAEEPFASGGSTDDTVPPVAEAADGDR